MTDKVSKLKKTALLLSVLIVISIAILGFFELPLYAQIQSQLYENVAVKFFDAGSENVVIIATDPVDNQNKLISLEKALIKNNISFYNFSSDSTNTDIINKSIDKLMQEKGIDKSKTIIIGYGTAGHFSIEDGYMAGIALTPYRIISNVYRPDHPLLIAGVSSDRYATPEMLTHLYNIISDDAINSTGFAFNASKNGVSLIISSGASHTYQSFSTSVIESISTWTLKNTGTNLFSTSPVQQYTQVALWIIMAALSVALFITITMLLSYLYADKSMDVVSVNVKDAGIFFGVRLFVWLLSLPAMLIIGGIAWLFAQGNTSISLVFALYLFGSGMSMLYLYKKGKMPGVEGKLDHRKGISRKGKANLWAILSITIVVMLFFTYHFTGLFGIDISTKNIIAMVFFSILCYPSFYVFTWETTILRDINANPYIRYGYMLGQYIPLAVVAVASVPIGYGKGLFTSIIYIIGIIVTLSMGRLIYASTNNQHFSSILQAISFGGFLALTIL